MIGWIGRADAVDVRQAGAAEALNQGAAPRIGARMTAALAVMA